MGALQRYQQLADGAAVERVLGAVAGEPLEGPAEADEWHGPDPKWSPLEDAATGGEAPATRDVTYGGGH